MLFGSKGFVKFSVVDELSLTDDSWIKAIVNAGPFARWNDGDVGGGGDGDGGDDPGDDNVGDIDDDGGDGDSPGGQKDNQTWDKERQFRDELAAANRREQQIREQNAALEAERNKFREQLAEMQKRFENAELDDPSLDEYDNLKKRVLEQDKKLQISLSRLEESQNIINQLQSQMQQQLQSELQREGEKMLDKECAKLDKKYGAQFRSEALTRIQKEYNEFDIDSLPPKPKSEWIKKALVVAYRDLADEAASKNKDSGGTKREKPSGSVDPGVGGAPPNDDIPEGTFSEVAAAIDARNRRLAGG